MSNWEEPVFGPPFELWREDGILHLVLAKGAQLAVEDVKELIRLVGAMDRGGRAPVLIEHSDGASVNPDAGSLLTRVCGSLGHPVVVRTSDLASRRQLELFREMRRPAFPFEVFERRSDACDWALARVPQGAPGVEVRSSAG